MFPQDLRYTNTHEWVQVDGDTVRVGITDYAADAMGDIVFVSLPTVGDVVDIASTLVELESTKSVAESYAPVSGVITAVNDQVEENPETVNADPYGEGWLFELKISDASQLDNLLEAGDYEELVANGE
jgi:glycine cleavage system H protein